MDKYEYKVRADEIKALIEEGDFARAADIADTIDWRRVKSVMMLCTVSDLYKINRRYEDAKNMLLLAYERRPGGRTICYSLCELCTKTEEFVQALKYYKEFVQAAPKDPGRYILQYRLYEAQEVSLEERIGVLEELKKRDYREKWAYELAFLYHRVGLATRCVEECDEMILWFGDGKYVIKAMELKMLHQPLTPGQQQIYDHRFDRYLQTEPEEPEESAEYEYDQYDQPQQFEEEMTEEDGQFAYDQPAESEEPAELDIQVKTMDVGKYNTINLQAELAEGLQEVLGEAGTAGTAQVPISTEADIADEGENDDLPEAVESVGEPGEETIEETEVFFGETGEISRLPVEKAPVLRELDAAEERAREVEPTVREQPSKGQTMPEQRAPGKQEAGPVAVEEESEHPDATGAAVMEALRREENMAIQPPRELAEVLSQEADGQISLVLPEDHSVEKQLTGQMKIEDVLVEWERMKKENEEKCREEVRRHVLRQTGPMFTEFEASVRDGLLEQLENGTAPGGTEPNPELTAGAEAVTGEEESFEEMTEVSEYMEGDDSEAAEYPDGELYSDDMEGTGEWEEPEEYSDEEFAPGEPDSEDESQEPPADLEYIEDYEDAAYGEAEEAESSEYAEEAYDEAVYAAEEALEPEYAEEAYDEAAYAAEEASEPEYAEEAYDEAAYAAEEASEPEYAEEAYDEAAYAAEEASEPEYAEETYDGSAHAAEEATEPEYPKEGYEDNGYEEEAVEEQTYIEEEGYEGEDGLVYEEEPENDREEADSAEADTVLTEEPENGPEGNELTDEAAALFEELGYGSLGEAAGDEIAQTEEGSENRKDTRKKTERENGNQEKHPMQREKARARGLTREEKELYAPFIQSRHSREQLVKAIDSISMAAYTGNIVVTGEEGMDTLTLAKNMIREVRLADSNFSGKVAKISGQGLNDRNISETLERLNNGALIIENASGMSGTTAKKLYKSLQQERLGIIVALEGTKKAVNKLFAENPELAGCFTARMDLEALSNDTLVSFGRLYAREMEYSIDDLGVLALHTRIEELQTIDHVVTVIEVKQIVDEAIHRASRKTLGHFFDILFAKRYDSEDMIILTEKDFVA